ncbi:hypothetical protein P3W33_11415 [Luteibacter sp. PPL552]
MSSAENYMAIGRCPKERLAAFAASTESGVETLSFTLACATAVKPASRPGPYTVLRMERSFRSTYSGMAQKEIRASSTFAMECPMTDKTTLPPFKTILRPHRRASHRVSDATTGAGQINEFDSLLTFAAEDLGFRPDPLPVDNLLKVDVKDDDLLVTVPLDPDEMDTGDLIYLQVDGVDHESDGVAADLDVGTAEVPLKAAWRQGDGEHTIRYVCYFQANQNTEKGPLQRFIVDTKAPGSATMAGPRFTVDDGFLKPEHLEADGSLKGMISGYEGLAAGDRIQLTIDGGKVGALQVVDGLPGGDMQIEVTYPADAIAEMNDGEREFGYRVIDRAGNESLPSNATALMSLLEGYLGSDLAAPIVPSFDDDGIINDADARAPLGVEVVIPGNVRYNTLPGLKLRISWGGTFSQLASVPMTADAFSAYLGYAAVAALWLYMAGADTDTPVTTEVRYDIVIERSGMDPLVVGRSLATTVIVNLHTAGGVDPDPGTPEHDNLAGPTLTSASGATNAIPLEDYASDATLSAAAMTDESTPKPIFRPGDVVTFFHGTTALPEYVIPDDYADEDIEVVLDADVIDDQGVGDIVDYYTVARTITGGDAGESTNVSTSRKTPVRVYGPAELPGGGAPPPEPVWTNQNDRNTIGPADEKNGVIFEVPVYKNKKTTDHIFLRIPVYGVREHGSDEDDQQNEVKDRFMLRAIPTLGENEPSSVTITSGFIYIGQDPKRTHAHVTYKVIRDEDYVEGGDQETMKGTVSEAIIVKIDSRGD